MSDETEALRRRNLRTVAALAALFLVPLTAAFVDYYATSWRPAGHVNHGRLITPARPLPAVALPAIRLDAPGAGATADAAPAAALRGKWSLVYLGDGACDADCAQALYTMRQSRLALNADMTRVARVFLVTGGVPRREFLAREHSGLTLLDASVPAAAALTREFPAADRAHTLYVVDPLGNLLMSYDARNDPHGLLEDLQQLLRLSHIG
ncbi:MAG: hypothetical protein JO361_00770 [Gammaproteobacteria bacterium]|nr:hypothetical protein [Gammaproteobacteria bacterium]